ncbi:MAG: SUF system NifU family Fe-S cluster assembly protein [Puniceicoccales bacterium]|jgi:nitrogen fixation NifU-like protein|nr:SUF system NifU family Fe-S cluster assembly protein [Puniceicoccales bacterium]
MDDSLQELYQAIILEHNRAPCNKCVPISYDFHADGYNPSCGDKVSVYVNFDRDRVAALSFSGEGCAISQASASLMTQLMKNKTKLEALAIIDDICRGLSGEDVDLNKYGDVGVLIGVRKFPMRIKCATMAWHTLKDAIQDAQSQDS